MGKATERKIDSYELFFSNFNVDIDTLFEYGFNSLFVADFERAEKQYEAIKNKLNNNETVCIRSFGRNGSNSQLYLDLYRYLFDNSNIMIDCNNNYAPKRNITRETGHKICDGKGKGDLLNYQVSHIWGKTKNPILFESVWNICLLPKLFDPLSGHEARGTYRDKFQKALRDFTYKKYKKLIDDYNQFVDNNGILDRITTYFKNEIDRDEIENNVFDDFKASALSEWEPIKV